MADEIDAPESVHDLDDRARSWLEQELGSDLSAELGFSTHSKGVDTDHPATNNPVGPEAEQLDPVHPPALIALLDAAAQRGASDLHVAPGDVPHSREIGRLRPMAGMEPFDADSLRRLLLSLLSRPQRETLSRDGGLDLVLALPSGPRVRVNMFEQDAGLGAAFRLLPQQIPALAGLGLPDAVADLTTRGQGLLLVTGPTGSGKTTTMAAIVGAVLDREPVHVLTIEDPIEYRFSAHSALVTQRQIGVHVPDFAHGLRQALRQDPDVILVGEMRDPETIAIALTAAETGHLVIATLHSRTAEGTVTRIVDSFPGSQENAVRAQLAASLVGVVAQQLVPTQAHDGRVLAAEVLVANTAVRNLIREGKLHQIGAVVDTGREHGMCSMDQALADLVRRGEIDAASARGRCVDGRRFEELLR